MTNHVGQQFGNYRLVRSLGGGGFAAVYLGEHIYLRSNAAIKVLHTQLTEEDRDQFLVEAQTLAHLVHPHIVRVLEFGVNHEGTAFLVMEYLPRGTLHRLHPSGSCLALATIASYVQQIASALQYAHDHKIIHRDVKPANILLGSGQHVLLGDFGIALPISSNMPLEKPGWVGTVPYMAPELFEGQPCFASDQYALGILAYEWLCGTRPFHGNALTMMYHHTHSAPPSLRVHDPSLPLAVEKVVFKALEKDPQRRYSSVLHFAQALWQACQTKAMSSAVPLTPEAFPPGQVAQVAPPRRLFLFATPGHEGQSARLAQDLQGAGIEVWNEQDHFPMPNSASEAEARREMRAADMVLLLDEPSEEPSLFVQQHVRLVVQYQRPLVILRLAAAPPSLPLPAPWPQALQVKLLDASVRPYEEMLSELLAILTPSEREEGQVTQQANEPRPPYKGLRAFTQADAGDFFGRERLTAELLARVKGMVMEAQAGRRLLAVLGPSGVGKSSVVQAGLLPQLQQGTVPGSQHWVYLKPTVPGVHPLETFEALLTSYFSPESWPRVHQELHSKDALGLHRLAQAFVQKESQRVVVFIDQFEELFAPIVPEEERRQFIDLLVTAALQRQGPVVILLTLRTDFYHRSVAYPRLHQLIEAQQKTVLPLETEELRSVITGPAALPDVQLAFEGDLVSELLFAMQDQPGALPLLQFTLEHLFQHRKEHLLTLSAYRAIGGVRGALAQQAEAAYKGLPSEDHRDLARTLFLRLIDPGETQEDLIRRRAALSEFALADHTKTRVLRETLDAFVEARLLTTTEVSGIATVEVSHEALLLAWPRLEEWIRTARQDILLQQTVSRDVADWQRDGRPRARLYRGSQLPEALTWARRNPASAEEQAFLRASQKRRTLNMVNLLVGVIVLLASVSTTAWFGLQAKARADADATVRQAQLTATAQAVGVRNASLTATTTEQNRRQQCAQNYLRATTANGIMFGFNAQHTGTNPYECTLSADNVATLVVRWSAPIDNYFIQSSPAVANGIVYVGSVDYNLHAFDASTGQEKWSSPTGGEIQSSPAVANGIVYIGSDDGSIYAFDASTGVKKWSSPTEIAIESSPAVANGIVYVGSVDYNLYAFDASTGQEKWSSPTGDSIGSSPAVANGIVYIGSDDGSIYAFDASTGVKKWNFPIGRSSQSSPAVANGIVYIGSGDGSIYAFDASTGQEKWSSFTGNFIGSLPAVANGIVYVGSIDGYIYAFDASTGEKKWSAPTGGGIQSSPAVVSGIVYISSSGGKLYAFGLAA